MNIPSSRFLRPYHAVLFFLEKRKVKRIKDSMTYAAKHGEVFHLWWHPHNFGMHREQMLKQLEEILSYYKFLNQKYGMQSMNMSEIAEHYEKNHKA